MITSYSEQDGALSTDESKVDPSHSIHLRVIRTAFVSEAVQTSVILSSGGRFQSSRNLFEDNAGDSIIKLEGGTMEMSRTTFEENTGNSIINVEGGTVEVSQTTFSMNEVTEGIVVLDDDSELKSNEDNCIYSANDDSAESGRKLQNGSCGGIIVEGECEPFDECIDVVGADVPTPFPTAIRKIL